MSLVWEVIVESSETGEVRRFVVETDEQSVREELAEELSMTRRRAAEKEETELLANPEAAQRLFAEVIGMLLMKAESCPCEECQCESVCHLSSIGAPRREPDQFHSGAKIWRGS